MNFKRNYVQTAILIVLAFFISLTINLSNTLSRQIVDEHLVVQKARELQVLIESNRLKGRDVSKAIEFDKQSIEVFKSGRYDEALRLIEEAMSTLKQDIKDTKSEKIAGNNISPVQKTHVNKIANDSPFGIHDPIIPEVDTVADVAAAGAKWIRYAGRNGILWDAIEREKGKYFWDYHDRLYGETYRAGIKINVVVLVYNRFDREKEGFGYVPKNINRFLEFLKKAVERYDGDGIDDAPGSPVIDVWEIENEPDLAFFPGAPGWKDTPKNYAQLLKKSYQVIKKINPNAKVAFAGLADPQGIKNYFIPVLNEIERIKDSPNDKYFEIAGFHWSGMIMGDYQKEIFPAKTYYLDSSIKTMKEEAEKRGYKNIPIWIGEMSYNNGKPTDITFLKQSRSEREQAIELVKRYVYSIVKGADKIFWVTLTEWNNWKGKGYFDHAGLINNPKNDGQSHRKLSYYTFRKISDKLEGSDWNNIQTIQENEGIYIYQFTKQGRPIWLCWNDNKKSIEIPRIESSKVKVISAIPTGKSGKDVEDYRNSFKERTLNVDKTKISLTLDDIPVIIELP
jgi:hypothetical protein